MSKAYPGGELPRITNANGNGNCYLWKRTKICALGAAIQNELVQPLGPVGPIHLLGPVGPIHLLGPVGAIHLGPGPGPIHFQSSLMKNYIWDICYLEARFLILF
jgi:hypothetical protein